MEINMKNNQIDKTLSSLDNIQRAKANPNLYKMIRQRLNSAQQNNQVKPTLAWQLTIACLLLLTINVLSLMDFYKVERINTQSLIQELYSEYISNNNTYGY